MHFYIAKIRARFYVIDASTGERYSANHPGFSTHIEANYFLFQLPASDDPHFSAALMQGLLDHCGTPPQIPAIFDEVNLHADYRDGGTANGPALTMECLKSVWRLSEFDVNNAVKNHHIDKVWFHNGKRRVRAYRFKQLVAIFPRS